METLTCSQPCPHTEQIKETRELIKEMHQIICGNGKWGLVHKFTFIKWTVIVLILRFIFEIPVTNALAFVEKFMGR